MATKKQVRARVAAQRAAFEEEVRLSGLAAQKADHKRREAAKQRKLAAEDAERKRKHEEQLAKEARPLVATYGLTEDDAKRIIRQARDEEPKATDRQLAIIVGRMVREEFIENNLNAFTDEVANPDKSILKENA